MKPTVISNANVPTCPGNRDGSGNGITIPINHEYGGQPTGQRSQQSQYSPQSQQYISGEPQMTSYGSPNRIGRDHRQQQQEIPSHMQMDFNFEPDVGMDMFPRTRLGRMTHDPFGDFGSTTRKRTSLHDPLYHTDGFSRYFGEDADFDFPQFNSLGRRRINPHNNDDLFTRLPSEFRQYIPETFSQRRPGPSMAGNLGSHSTMSQPQQPSQHQPQTSFYNIPPQSPIRKVCDAAIQTEAPAGRSEVDHVVNTENLYPCGLRNTMDMGIKSPSESGTQSPRSSSAPPAEKQHSHHQQKCFTQPQHIHPNGSVCPSPPSHQTQFVTQPSPQLQPGCYNDKFQNMHYSPHHQAHPQHKQQNSPPQTPGGSYVRTIPIFVEGRSEPIISNKEIPNQNSSSNTSTGSGSSRAFTPPRQQTHRPTPLNTQQQPAPHSGGRPPQTPQTVDTINKIQDIQRDVLDLMSRVEKFAGTRGDKEYVYLDEMLTRNLLKLDNIDTNGKESIRLARKEAIKCIEASINVLEAKAEENKKAAQANNADAKENSTEKPLPEVPSSPVQSTELHKSMSAEATTKESTPTTNPVETILEPADNKINEPIPLPPPEREKFNEVKIEDCPDDDALSPSSSNKDVTPKPEIPEQNDETK